MKLRNVRRRQWDRYIARVIEMERKGWDPKSVPGYMHQWSARMERYKSKQMAQLKHNQVKWQREFLRDTQQAGIPRRTAQDIIDRVKHVSTLFEVPAEMISPVHFTGIINEPGITIREPD